MNVDNCLMTDEKHQELCKIILKVLTCDVLWVMTVQGGLLTILTSDSAILEHYVYKKYYLQDPNVPLKRHPKTSTWNMMLGNHAKGFKKSGFLYDLQTLFKVEEFASIEQSVADSSYCFRFFTRNNRFVFMNKLLNNMSFIKFFMNAMIKELEDEFHKNPGIKIHRIGLE